MIDPHDGGRIVHYAHRIRRRYNCVLSEVPYVSFVPEPCGCALCTKTSTLPYRNADTRPIIDADSALTIAHSHTQASEARHTVSEAYTRTKP